MLGGKTDPYNKLGNTMLCDIYWNHLDGEIEALPVEVLRIGRGAQKLHIHFRGQEPEYGTVFSGVLVLQLTVQHQEIASFYINTKKGPPSSEKKIAFTLHGNFTDQTFSEFRGLWTEEGERYEFEVIGIPSEKSAG